MLVIKKKKKKTRKEKEYKTNAILDIFRWRQAQLKKNESFKVGQPFPKSNRVQMK